MTSFQSLFDANPDIAEASSSAMGDDGGGDERAAKRLKSSYTLHVGPKFRDEHKTDWRATNLHVIKAESSGEQSLYDYVIDDVNAGTVRGYSDLDILIKEYMHPRSPKMITMALKHMNMEGEMNPSLRDLAIPLYLCLTDDQINDVLNQLGMSNHTQDIGFIPMNRGRALYPPRNEVDIEQFVNEVVGKMSRYNTNVNSTWDSQKHFFQPIRFKIRVGPERSVVNAIKNVKRGNPARTKIYGPDDFQEEEYTNQADQFRPSPSLKSERDDMLDRAGEDGQFYAATVQHPFEMTSHTAMSPKFRAAINQAATYFDTTIDTKSDLEKFIVGKNRAHFATIIESELLESETSLRTYRDPTASSEHKKKKIFAIYSIKKNLSA